LRRQAVQINVSSRHAYISSELKDYAISRVEQLRKYSDHITNVDVVIDHEKDSHKVEVVAHVGHGSTLIAKHTGEVLPAVMDATLDKLERQMRKLKDRLHDHRPHHPPPIGPPVPAEPEEGEEELFEGEAEFEKEL
jgi:putative sigma-54 modulation protein